MMMLKPVRTIEPTEALLNLQETIRHCRVADDADTTVTISALIQGATDYLDGYAGVLGRALVSQTWRQDLGCFYERIRLPLAPLISVTGVTYYDTSNVQQTLATSVYAALTDDIGPYIALKYNQVWPQLYTRDDAISVTASYGYGTAADVPQAIKQAALLLISHWNEHREAVGDQMAPVPMAVDALLTPYRRVTP